MPRPPLTRRFRLDEVLISQGDRRVWRGLDPFGRAVAIKGAFATPGDDAAAAVFAEHARLSRCRHPRLARGLELGWADVERRGSPAPFAWFTTRWIPGPSLRSLRGGLSEAQLCALAEEVLEIVAFLHQARVVDLDLKPDHLIHTEVGWRLIDLDQARADSLLGPGALRGTLPYLAPEILAGAGSGGPRGDLYSVGALLYEAAEGTPPPLRGETLEEVARWLSASPVPALGAGASQALTRLILALMARDPSARPASAEAALTLLSGPGGGQWRRGSPPPRGPLVGRAGALRALDDALASAAEAGGGALELVAPPEGGASRLLEAWAAAAGARGEGVIAIPPVEGAATLGPMRSLIQAVCAIGGGSLSPLPAPPAGEEALPAWREAALRDAVSSLREAGAAAARLLGRPCAVILDDLSRWDELSLTALRRLLDHRQGSGLHLVLSAAPQDWGPSDLPRLPLAPLTEEEIRSLAEALLGPGALRSASEARALLDATGGQPGEIRRALTPQWRDPHAPIALTQEGASAELAARSPAARLTAQALALLEGPADAALVGAVLGASPTPALAELVGAGLAEARGAEGEEPRYALTPPPLGRAVAAALSAEEARALSARAAEALEERSFLAEDPPAGALARLFIAGGMSHRARPWLRRALEDARRALRTEEEAALLERLRAQAPRGGRARLELSERLAEVELSRQRPDAADRVLAEELAQAPPPSAEAARCRATWGRALIHLGRLGEGRAQLRQALDEARAAADPPRGVRWAHLMAWAAAQQGAPDAASAALAEASAWRLTPAEDLAHRRLAAELILRQGGDPRPIAGDLAAAVDAARAAGDARAEAVILNTLARALRAAGDLDGARARLGEMEALARRQYDLHLEADAAHNLAVAHREAQDGPAAAEGFRTAADLYRRLGNQARELHSRLGFAQVLLDHGDADRARGELDRARALITEPLAPPLALQLRLLELRGAGDDDALAQLEADARAAQIPEIRLAAASERMARALEAGAPDQALRRFAEVVDAPRTPDTQEAWASLHGRAIEAHRALQPRRPGSAAAPEVPRPLPLRPPLHSAAPAGRQEAGPVAPLATDDGADEDLRWLSRIQRLLEVSDDEASLAAALAHLVGEALGGRGLVFIFEGDRPDVVRGFGVDAVDVGDISETLIEAVRAAGAPLRYADVRVAPQLASLRSIRAADVKSVVCAPVLSEGQCLGVIYVDHREGGQRWSLRAHAWVAELAGIARGLLEGIRRRRQRLALSGAGFGLVGRSAAMRRLRAELSTVVTSPSAQLRVYLFGEIGVGKSSVARAIHAHGRRAEGPFVEVSCPAIPPASFESEVFGHARGSFTGALARHAGYFAQGRGGTVFMDEIDKMPLDQQAKLLTALGNGRYRPMGGAEEVLDVHLISATNKDLRKEVAEGGFLEDLLRRIRVNPIRIPPLRERGEEDIRLLASHFLAEAVADGAAEVDVDPPPALQDAFTRHALGYLVAHPWPWNVAEMKALFDNEGLRRALRTRGREKVGKREVREILEANLPPAADGSQARATALPQGLSYEDVQRRLGALETDYVMDVLWSCDGNVAEAAHRLRASRDTLYKHKRRWEERQER